jgi:hypothetical protein
MRLPLVLLPALLYAVEPTLSVPAGKGAFIWKNVSFTAKGTAQSLKLEFRGSVENQTQQPWGQVKFCVKGFDANERPVRTAQSECLIDLTGFNLQPGGFLNYKYSPKISIGAGKEPITLARYEISVTSGGQDPPNTRRLSAGCDAVWSAIVPVVAKRGFMPESSDKAGGFMKLRYARGGAGWLASDKNVKELTEHRVGLLETYDQFEISAGSLSLTPDGDACRAMLQFEYRGFKKDPFSGTGWYALPSNGHLESGILDELQTAVAPK